MKKVVVIGAGIIGCSTAYHLVQKGYDVLVVDFQEPGHGCSYGNAGWMTPCFALPLPMPGMMFKSMKWLLDSESPLYIQPKPSKLLIEWMFRFLKSMSHTQAKNATEVLVALSMNSLQQYQKLSEKHSDLMKFQKKGLLMISQHPDGKKAAVDELLWTKEFGVSGEIVDGKRAQEIEPSLQGPIAGGVYFQNEAHAEPLGVVRALKRECELMGVRFLTSEKVIGLKESSLGRVHSVRTENNEFEANHFVFATGSWSTGLAKILNMNIPILGGKGYSLIFEKPKAQPQVPLMFIEKKIAVTPRENSLRIAGTLELVDQDFSITERRVQAIIKGARQYLDLPETLQIQETWRGLRPCTPDGLPMIGLSSSFKNVYVNFGHQMLGLQSGLGSGQILAKLLDSKAEPLSETDSLYLRRLDPRRF